MTSSLTRAAARPASFQLRSIAISVRLAGLKDARRPRESDRGAGGAALVWDDVRSGAEAVLAEVRRPGHSVLSGPDSSLERPATAILWRAEDRREAPARSPARNRRGPQQHPLRMEQTLPPRQPRVVVWSCPWQRQAEVNRWPASGRDWAPEADPPSKPDHGEPGQLEQGHASGRTTDSGQRSEPSRSEPSRSEPQRPPAGRPCADGPRFLDGRQRLGRRWRASRRGSWSNLAWRSTYFMVGHPGLL